MTDLELIKKGFNAGYLLEKYDPELAKKILNSLQDKDIPYAQGYQAGVKEYARELFKEKMKERDRTEDRDKDRGYDR